MKAKTASKDTSWVTPGKMTHEEFVAGIKKAEDAAFYSVEQSQQHFEQWLKSRK